MAQQAGLTELVNCFQEWTRYDESHLACRPVDDDVDGSHHFQGAGVAC
jgi:hypothetical protein